MAKKQKQPPQKRKRHIPKEPVTKKSSQSRVFHRINYILMLIGAMVVGIGYLLMMGGRQAPAEFNYDEIYSFRRITLAPFVILLGFAIEIVAILWRPKKVEEPKNSM